MNSIARTHRPKFQGARTVALLLLVAQKDLVVFDLDNPVVGDGDPENIGGEVLDAPF